MKFRWVQHSPDSAHTYYTNVFSLPWVCPESHTLLTTCRLGWGALRRRRLLSCTERFLGTWWTKTRWTGWWMRRLKMQFTGWVWKQVKKCKQDNKTWFHIWLSFCVLYLVSFQFILLHFPWSLYSRLMCSVCVFSVQEACLGITWTHSHCSVEELHTLRLWVSALYRSVMPARRTETHHPKPRPKHTTTHNTTSHTTEKITTQTTMAHKGKTGCDTAVCV